MTPNSTPQKLLPVIERAKAVYRAWIPVHRDMPKMERFGVGSKIDFLFLQMFELLRRASYANGKEKIDILQEAIRTIDSLRFFIQLSWELLLISNTHYATLGEDIENIGRMVGGWRKGLMTKTPTP